MKYAPLSLTYELRIVIVILAILVDTISSCVVLEMTLGRIESYRSRCICLLVHCWANGEISLAITITERHIGSCCWRERLRKALIVAARTEYASVSVAD